MSALNDWTHERPEHWTEQAACASVYPELFYPERGGPAAAAKRVCESCPVLAICREDALTNDDGFGVKGGLTERERQAIRTTRRTAA